MNENMVTNFEERAIAFKRDFELLLKEYDLYLDGTYHRSDVQIDLVDNLSPYRDSSKVLFLKVKDTADCYLFRNGRWNYAGKD